MEVKEAEEVNEVKDEESRQTESLEYDYAQADGASFSFTSLTSFISFYLRGFL